MNDLPKPPTPRRWWRFSLRMLLLVVLLVNLGFGIMRVRAERRARATRLGRELIVAAFEVNLPEAQRLIDAGADVDARLGQFSEDEFQYKSGATIWGVGRAPATVHWTPLLALVHSSPWPDWGGGARTEGSFDEVVDTRHQHRVRIARLLLDAGADMNLHDGFGTTPLAHAVSNADDNSPNRSNEALALLFIERGADVNTRSDYSHSDGPANVTPLHDAGGNLRLVRALIAKGADVNARTTLGGTPLRYAADRVDIEVAKLLIAAGADLQIADRLGGTPLSKFASDLSESQMRELLDAAPAKSN